jgi:hypothetical protein
MAEEVLVGDVAAVAEVLENDEPQFKVPEQDIEKAVKPKASSAKGAIVLFCAVGLVVGAFYFLDDIMEFGKKQPAVKNPDSIATLEPTSVQPVVDDYEVQSLSSSSASDNVQIYEPDNQADAETSMPVSKVTQSVASTVQVDNGQGMNLVLANRLKELSTAVESLSSLVVDLNGQVLSVKNELGRQNLKVQRTLDNVVGTLEVARSGDSNRDALITKVLNDVRGFQKDIGDQRQRFSFKILHDEFYGGKQRLIGFEDHSPQTILKVYVGNDVGLWRLVSISNGEAVFRHVDGKEYRERLK